MYASIFTPDGNKFWQFMIPHSPKPRLLVKFHLGMVAVFYFFQGFGLLMDLLKHMKIVGMVRTLIFLSLILFGVKAGFFLALLGVLDNFKDFRKSFKKKSNEDEGDNL